jgi:hypothetical protein
LTALLVVVGATAGAPLGYLADLLVQSRHDTVFSWGTLTVNAAGSLIRAASLLLGLVACTGGWVPGAARGTPDPVLSPRGTVARGPAARAGPDRAGIGFAETAESTVVALALPDRLRGNRFGVLGLVLPLGDLGSCVVVGVLWATVSVTVVFGYAAAWMAASLLASGLLRPRPAGPKDPHAWDLQVKDGNGFSLIGRTRQRGTTTWRRRMR